MIFYRQKPINAYLLFLMAAGLLAVLFSWQCSSTQQTISYNEHIRPIFNKKCLSCHGGVRKLGGFSLLFEEEAFQPTESGEVAIVRGNHRKSELYRRLVAHDPELRMPKDADPLTEQEISLIAGWIDEGAQWEKHWAYTPPAAVKIPSGGASWARNDLDRFVWEKMQTAGLEPAPAADPATLARRVSLDLTGLPPEPGQLEAFVNNPTPEAYEKLVDQLLASPRFGERWASMWLDLARYADSAGYEKDPYRNIWRYREWVIRAFNRDLPFDQFTIEQLAGDMLPDPSLDQLLATAYHRNTMTNTEGGTDDEEFRVAAVIDRLNTTFEVWQATTMSCVQCHSHPYDPIRHEEFFQAYDFFNQTQDGDQDVDAPRLELYPEEDARRIKEIAQFVAQLEPERQLDTNVLPGKLVRQAIFPVLSPIDCDDFENVQFGFNGSVSNWIYNLKSIDGKRFRFHFAKVDLDGLESITYHYKSEGNEARIELRLDSLNGPLVNEKNFSANAKENSRWSGDGFEEAVAPVTPTAGTHDLYFEIINTTGKIPEGMVVIKQINLNYSDKYQQVAQRKKLREEILTIRSKKADYTPIMAPKNEQFSRQTKVFERGNWLTQTAPVVAKAPEIMLTGTSNPSNRLEFARWLVSKENPLTARVIVNRFWEQIFGQGLVETLEDFGTQSDQPTHPALLDHLALRFMNEMGWSVKALLREMVLSATYRQSSELTPEKLETDPDNKLYARGMRFRLSAEQVRDQALAVSGLLYDTIGGRSVMPPQPDGVWQIIYSNEQWKTPDDRNKYRRGIYTYWKRTTPYPSMMAFDSPSREFCVSRRIRTNTPLQALVTLNDPVFLEAAQALGREMERAGNGNLEAAIRMGYQRAMAKKPDAETVAILQQVYQDAARSLQQPKAQLTALGKADQESDFEIREPMTVVANVIMNLDGFLVKE